MKNYFKKIKEDNYIEFSIPNCNYQNKFDNNQLKNIIDISLSHIPEYLVSYK